MTSGLCEPGSQSVSSALMLTVHLAQPLERKRKISPLSQRSPHPSAWPISSPVTGTTAARFMAVSSSLCVSDGVVHLSHQGNLLLQSLHLLELSITRSHGLSLSQILSPVPPLHLPCLVDCGAKGSRGHDSDKPPWLLGNGYSQQPADSRQQAAGTVDLDILGI